MAMTGLMHRTVLLFTAGALVTLAAVSCSAQSSRADSHTARADSLLTHGDPAGARLLYEAALAIDEHKRNALLGLGKAFLELDLWSDAKDSFNAILEKDTADIAAHYYAGIAYRETGKTKAWILRNIDWGNSREEFFWVMRHDSAYNDVFYQYALLMECRKEYPEAIAAGHTQLLQRPDVAQARLGLYRLYRSFVANDRAVAIEWLRKERTPIALYFLADALRRDNRLDEAEKLLGELFASDLLRLTQSIHLSLTRIAAKRGNAAGAEQSFWRAVDEIYTQLGADLVFEDLKYLVTDRELEVYRSLDSPQKKAAFFHAFWDLRNPAAAGASNVRIGEHYRRLVYAEENYEYLGFRTGFNNPDRFKELSFPKSYALNQELNDMGLIYVRHGEPSNRQRTAQAIDPSESWLYEATSELPRRIFHFQKKNAPGNNWRLVPYPEDGALLELLTNWDIKFADLLRNNASAKERAKDEIREESRETVGEGLTTDEHKWKKEVTAFQFPYSVDAFRGTGPKSLVDISFAIPLASLAAGSSGPDKPIPTEIGIAIRSGGGQTTLTKLDTVTIPPARNERDTYTNLYRYLIPADRYSIAMHVRPLEGNSFGNWKMEKLIRKPTGDLSISDLQFLLPSSIKTTLEIDGVKVVPSPFSAYPNNRPLYAYIHIYNLVKDAEGKTSYSIHYFLTPAAGEGTLPTVDPDNPDVKTILLAEKTKDDSEAMASEFGALDIGDVKAGRYVLSVVVKDRKRVQTVSVQRRVDVFEP